jgi:manganese-dependent inorganic pyrophosphatase
MNREPPRIQKTALFEEARDALVNSRYRGLPVFDGEEFFGIVSRRCFIERPKKELILVDHNETRTASPGLRTPR